MRENDGRQKRLFVKPNLETKVREDLLLRQVHEMVNVALKSLSPRFSCMHSTIRGLSIPPKKLLRALLLQLPYSILSERKIVDHLDRNPACQCFMRLAMNAPPFSQNRDRLIDSDIAPAFLRSVTGQVRKAGLISDEYCGVDGTLSETMASLKSVHPKDDSPSPGESGRDAELNFRI